MSHSINITRIKAVNNALSKLETPVVFVGGATVSLYSDINLRDEVRPTDDVDVVVEIAAYKNFAAIESKLRELGFENDTESKIICRYKYRGIIIDIMPADEKVLGFSNKWYAPGFKQAIDFVIDKQHRVKIFPVAYFIAGKLEAFKSRGNNDGRSSTDFEDIMFVLNARSAIWENLRDAPKEVNEYLKKEFSQLLAHPYIDEWISVHLNYNEQNRVNFIISSLTEFVNTKKN
jgi:predicted nucleotidyltransferase